MRCYLIILHGNPWFSKHIYAKLECGDCYRYLSRCLTQEEADRLNVIDRHKSYQAGQLSERFLSRNDINQEAKRQWRNLFPNALELFDTYDEEILDERN